jgi:hypothetical protein
MWLISWYSKRSISGYAAQTMQFLIFLLVFLTLYSISIQSGYSTQIELSLKDELRTSSVFAALALSGNEALDGRLLLTAAELDFGEHNEVVVIVRTATGFALLGNETVDISYANDLLFSAWQGQASVTGIRGAYKYGVTVIVDNHFEI